MPLNRVTLAQGKRFLVCSRDVANDFVEKYDAKRAAGEPLRPEENLSGILSVGDRALDAIQHTRQPVDYTCHNLAGKTDLTIDPVGQKQRTMAGERKPRSRVETPQTFKARRETMLSALFAVNAAFMNKPDGVVIIHCEHGLHRAPAYFYANMVYRLARRITLDHLDRATDADANFFLNKDRLIRSARSIMWAALGQPEPGSANDPDAFSPYPRIMRVGEEVAIDLYDGLTPAMTRQERERRVAEKEKLIMPNPPKLIVSEQAKLIL